MARHKFKATLRLLEKAGFETSQRYDESAFGSWLIEIAIDPPLRVLWDGKDGWLMVQRETSEVFAGQRVWRDLWVARDPENHIPEVAVSVITKEAAKNIEPVRGVSKVRGKEIVARGSWIYGGVARKPVYIVQLDHDFWYEIAKAEEQLEAGEEPILNEKGVLITYPSMASVQMALSGLIPVATRRWRRLSRRRSADCLRLSTGSDVPWGHPVTLRRSGA